MTERWLDLSSGGRIDLATPQAKYIVVEDIAGALLAPAGLTGIRAAFIE